MDVAPAPLLPGFDAAHYRMRGAMEVCGCVSAGRRVAAAYMPADQALTQVDPAFTELDTLRTANGVGCGRGLDPWLNLLEVIALRHWQLPPGR